MLSSPQQTGSFFLIRSKSGYQVLNDLGSNPVTSWTFRENVLST